MLKMELSKFLQTKMRQSREALPAEPNLVCSSKSDDTKKETNQIDCIVSEYMSISSTYKFLTEVDYNK